MISFPQHDETTAPEPARETLAAVKADFGMIPNLERTMASAPPLLEAYATAWELFDRTSLSPVERQIVYQTANFENECDYCVPWHTLLSQKAGMAPVDVEALRRGAALSDPKEEALRRFTQTVVRTRGNIAEADLEAFAAAGWGAEQALEVVLGVAIKTMSNYTNSIAATPLDKPVQKLAWTKPVIKPRAS
ncbi:MAG: carboxymuconolactone decarboxylase family protein [Pseudomonadota bacterium]